MPLTLPILTQWKAMVDENNIVFLSLDCQNTETNTLSKVVVNELKQVLDAIEASKVAGLVIRSLKEKGFIAGADVQIFKTFKSVEEARSFIDLGQSIFKQLADLPCPTLALIHGFCLGGGLELALACRYRIVDGDMHTKLGLPEVMLGIHPGWGGTVRLPRLTGALSAMDLILSGRQITSKEALKIGLVDAIVPKRNWAQAILHFILKKPKAHHAFGLRALSNWEYIRPQIGKVLLKKLSAKVNQNHYPAPFAALDHWIRDGVDDSAFVKEAESVSQLATTETARNLLRVFFLQEKLKSLGKALHFMPKHVHVVGAGVMGGDIAAFCALQGFSVSLQDNNSQAIAKAVMNAQLLFQKRLKEPHEVRAAMDRLMPDPSGIGIPHADIIIEAIVEKRDAKQALFHYLESVAKNDAILATNTSTIPLQEIGRNLKDRQRLVGLHFFNPVAKMPLVEVVSDEKTAKDVQQRALAFVRAIGKLPVPVKSAPGFLVNRILVPYLMESMALFEEGLPKEVIDHAALAFGMPMGPIELADVIGLDVCLYSMQELKALVPSPVPEYLRVCVEKGHLGKKTGQGFYQYDSQGRIIKKAIDLQVRGQNDITDRLILRMVNEAVACLREGIVSDPDYVDAGTIFGIGFPPFRGGLLHYAKEEGSELLLQRLNLLAQRYGERFIRDEGWHLIEA